MNWKTAVERSPHGLAVALVEKGHALRAVNAAKEMFKIDSPQGEPVESKNSTRMLGRLDWRPVEEPLKRFTRFTKLMEMAGAAPKSLCELHAGQRGLAAMIADWHHHRETLKELNERLQSGTTSFDDSELPNLLEEISIQALAMRALL